ncbi:Psg1p Ecym_3425 [Eremothecium cymbalariae DBVPG|uniref:Uncharacterized protein n=1 Tax=Eremothecium cymbalariae (strain CBS 270.75 / DBVPG 7215 / KCTC 17166 / NRRL Y-17582) TaxID=931890 RepID=G8JRZ2_ERECY|nr:Hypothetical protein Ecym_3425 [Eremothecium cymbalariae DBVPG\
MIQQLLVFLTFSIHCCYGWHNVIRPQQSPKTTTEELKPWVRTIYGTKVELVTPTVIAGVTFSAKPEETPDPLKPWVSLKQEGLPVTVKPEIKKGHTIRASPDYSTYFKTASTRTYTYEDLKAHNMDPGDIHKEVMFVDEDDAYVSLNPIIRCTPERYFHKGDAKDIPSEPFCTPMENKDWQVGKTYFVSWYTRFFRDEVKESTVEQVRVHLSYVQETAYQRGFAKRDIKATFFSSEWIDNIDGLYPITVDEDWLQGKPRRSVVVSVQPSTVSDEEFNPLEFGVLIKILRGSKVFKTTKEELALQDAGIHHRPWYYVILTVPTIVAFTIAVMYFLSQCTGKYRDFSDVTRMALNKKHRVLGKIKDMKRFKKIKNHKYDELPIHRKSGKQT